MRNKNPSTEKSDEEADIYDVIASALMCGLRFSDLGNMTYVQLLNILDVFSTKEHKPTQQEIDIIS